MKILLLLLGLSLTLAAYIPSGYTELSLESAGTDSAIQNALNFGVENVLDNLLNSKNIKDTNFQVSKVNSIAKLVQNSETFYAFEVELKNQNTVVKSKFIVQIKANISRLYYSSSSVNTASTFSPVFTEVPTSEYQSSQLIQGLRNYGLNQVVDQVLQKYQNASHEFTVKTTNSAQRSIVSDNQVIYKFDIKAGNHEGFVLKTHYAVSYNPNTAEKRMLTSNYEVVVHDKLGDLDALGKDFFLVHQADVDKNALIQNIIVFGVNEIQRYGFAHGKLPSTDFILHQTKTISRLVRDAEIDYKCEVVMSDKKGTTLYGTFLVRFNLSTTDMKFFAYSFNTKSTS